MSGDFIDNEQLNNLSEEEKQEVYRILNEMLLGEQLSYNKLVNEDYKEIPVDIITFIKDRRYLGDAWHSPEGECKLFPYWEDKLRELFPDPYTTNYNNFIESGARGLGKSEIAVTCILYLMYRAMCLKNPLAYYNLKPTEKLCFAFMNITEALAIDIGVNKFLNTVKMSPWFMERGTITGRQEEIWNPPPYIAIIIGSLPRHVIGLPILAAFCDEISFIPNQDVEKLKQKALDMIDTAIGGMKTRFMYQGKSPALLILASSKRSEKSFLETHMKKKAETEGDNTLIVDEPVWNIRPKSEYSGKTFYVAQGNKFLVSQVIPDTDTDILAYKNKGFKVIEVPVEYRPQFLEDIDRALCDYAGVSSSELTKYISANRLLSVKDTAILNLFVKDVLEIGNALDDKYEYSDFIDLSRLPVSLKSKPLYIHLDLSKSGDKTGIAGVWIKGKKASLENTPQELYYQLAFSVSIKAPKGYLVSFAKNRRFIYWLKNQGFNIKGVSSDTYLNAELEQDLISKGYAYEIISVDRVDSATKICKPYAYFKNTIYEERIKFYSDCELLTEELLGLERNGNTGSIDHPDGGRYGSKDLSDAVCGALYNASQHAEDFSFEFGEFIDAAVDVSNETFNEELLKQQITLDFEEELKKLLLENNRNTTFIDFGMGSAKELTSDTYYISQGIIV